MKEWLEYRQRKCDNHPQDNILWRMDLADMPATVLAKARVGEAALNPEARKEKRNDTASRNGRGIEDSQYAGAMLGSEPEKSQLQQQPKPKPKLQLKQQSEQQQETKHKPTSTPARRWETIQARTKSHTVPTSPGPALTSGLSSGERRLLLTRDGSVPLPNMIDQEIASAIVRCSPLTESM
jgi:hypothetical protein